MVSKEPHRQSPGNPTWARPLTAGEDGSGGRGQGRGRAVGAAWHPDQPPRPSTFLTRPSPIYTSVSTSSKWEQEQRSQPAQACGDPGSRSLAPGGSRLTCFTTLHSLQGATRTCRRLRVPGPILITLLPNILPAPNSLGPPRQGVLFCTPKSPLAQPRPSASSPFLPRWVQTHPPKTWVLASWMLLSLPCLMLCLPGLGFKYPRVGPQGPRKPPSPLATPPQETHSWTNPCIEDLLCVGPILGNGT